VVAPNSRTIVFAAASRECDHAEGGYYGEYAHERPSVRWRDTARTFFGLFGQLLGNLMNKYVNSMR
jgi:hypothetical protein